MSFVFTPMPRSLFRKQKGIATTESEMGAAWGEESLGIAWVSKHPDSKDESVEVGMSWVG